mmetsp:Transcript_124275/g.220231  ORF Transcript_124275/g.220231 Transcript_124275/m.220231 type:complete len:688 (+) Transcript_124275:70-2133(+)
MACTLITAVLFCNFLIGAAQCSGGDDVSCAAEQGLAQDAALSDEMLAFFQRKSMKKVLEDASQNEHIQAFQAASAKSGKASAQTFGAQPVFYDQAIKRVMWGMSELKRQSHQTVVLLMQHLNKTVMIATVIVCIVFRFSLLYSPSWLYNALQKKDLGGSKKDVAKMPFSHYIGTALRFTTAPLSPTWLYRVHRGNEQGTVLRASLWFIFLVPLILLLWCIVSSPTLKDRFLHFGMANVGIFQLGTTVIINLLAPWPEKPSDHKNNPEYIKKIGCIVPCHQSADEIAITVKSLLQFLEPEHIVVVDNGNAVKPLDDTAKRIQELEPRVQYLWVPIGMKTNALWVGLNNLPSSVEYVMHIDDDTELPPDFVFDESVWDHSETDAISYGITMYQTGLVEKFVDFEFKQFSQMRLFQSNLSTVWFQHGIIGIWRRPAFTEVLKEHPFLPFGEDNWNGTINLLKNKQMRQELRSFVKTYAPATMLPVTDNRQQGYGAANIWKQRAERWMVNAPRRFFIRLYLLFFYRHDTYTGSIAFKFMSVYHLVGILAHLCIPLAIIQMVSDGLTGHGYAGHAISNGFHGAWTKIALPFFTLLSCSMFETLFQNYVFWRHRPDIQVDLKVCLLFPFYRMFLEICCWYGHWRCLLWYVPFVPMRHGLYTEGGMNSKLLNMIHKIETAPDAADTSGKEIIKA